MIRRGLQLVPKFFVPQTLTRLGARSISFVNRTHLPSSLLLTRPRRYFAGTLSSNGVSTVNLPNLADSITEGRVQELKKRKRYP